MTSNQVAWSELPSRIGTIRVAATEGGICRVALGLEPAARFLGWIEQHAGQPVRECTGSVEQALEQIADYLDGKRKAFDLALDMRGTDFQRQVWQVVGAIPRGQTRTYAQVAEAVGRPTAIRAVGAANGANPLPLFIPCHRVIGSDGRLTGYGGGLDVKQWLLEMEGALT